MRMTKPTSRKAAEAAKTLRRISMWGSDVLPRGSYWTLRDAISALEDLATRLYELEGGGGVVQAVAEDEEMPC